MFNKVFCYITLLLYLSDIYISAIRRLLLLFMQEAQFILSSKAAMANVRLSLREKCPNTEIFLVHIFPHSDLYSVRMRKNTDQKKLRYWHFSRSIYEIKCLNESKKHVEISHILDLNTNLNKDHCSYNNGQNIWDKL